MRHSRVHLVFASCWFLISACIGQSSSAASPSGLTSPVTHTPVSSVSPRAHPLVQDFEQFAVYWTDEAGWHSELQLRNNLVSQDLTVIPALRSFDGNELTLASVTIKPFDVVSLDLHDAALSADPNHMPGYGSVALRYRATVLHALYAAVIVHDAGHPIAFHMDAFPQPKKFVTGSREGIWWLPNTTAIDYLILTNTSDKSLHAWLNIYDSSGSSSQQPVTLAARETQRLSVRTILERAGLAGTFGGIEVRVPNGAGYLDTAHVIFDETAGFGATMKNVSASSRSQIRGAGLGRCETMDDTCSDVGVDEPGPGSWFPNWHATSAPSICTECLTKKLHSRYSL